MGDATATAKADLSCLFAHHNSRAYLYTAHRVPCKRSRMPAHTETSEAFTTQMDPGVTCFCKAAQYCWCAWIRLLTDNRSLVSHSSVHVPSMHAYKQAQAEHSWRPISLRNTAAVCCGTAAGSSAVQRYVTVCCQHFYQFMQCSLGTILQWQQTSQHEARNSSRCCLRQLQFLDTGHRACVADSNQQAMGQTLCRTAAGAQSVNLPI